MDKYECAMQLSMRMGKSKSDNRIECACITAYAHRIKFENDSIHHYAQQSPKLHMPGLRTGKYSVSFVDDLSRQASVFEEGNKHSLWRRKARCQKTKEEFDNAVKGIKSGLFPLQKDWYDEFHGKRKVKSVRSFSAAHSDFIEGELCSAQCNHAAPIEQLLEGASCRERLQLHTNLTSGFKCSVCHNYFEFAVCTERKCPREHKHVCTFVHPHCHPCIQLHPE